MVSAPKALGVMAFVIVKGATQESLATTCATAEPRSPATTEESVVKPTMDVALAMLTLSKGSGRGLSVTRA